MFQGAGVAIWLTVQECGRMGLLARQTLVIIRFGKNTSDELYISSLAMIRGVRIENPGASTMVGSRNFGTKQPP